jgi:hypothetical protein
MSSWSRPFVQNDIVCGLLVWIYLRISCGMGVTGVIVQLVKCVGVALIFIMYTPSTVGSSPCLCSCVVDRSVYVHTILHILRVSLCRHLYASAIIMLQSAVQLMGKVNTVTAL